MAVDLRVFRTQMHTQTRPRKDLVSHTKRCWCFSQFPAFCLVLCHCQFSTKILYFMGILTCCVYSCCAHFFPLPRLNLFCKWPQNGVKIKATALLNLWLWQILTKRRHKQPCNSKNKGNLPPKCFQKQVGRTGEFQLKTLLQRVRGAPSSPTPFLSAIPSKTDPQKLKTKCFETFTMPRLIIGCQTEMHLGRAHECSTTSSSDIFPQTLFQMVYIFFLEGLYGKVHLRENMMCARSQ